MFRTLFFIHILLTLYLCGNCMSSVFTFTHWTSDVADPLYTLGGLIHDKKPDQTHLTEAIMMAEDEIKKNIEDRIRLHQDTSVKTALIGGCLFIVNLMMFFAWKAPEPNQKSGI